MAEPTFADMLASVQSRPPLAAVVLGSGLNEVTDGLPSLLELPFTSLPGMPAVTVTGHRGRLSLLEIHRSTLLVFQGRLHYYEGHSWDVVARPVHLAAELGVKTLILTNASGGIGAGLQAGTLLSVRDHIAAFQPNWWRQPGLGGAWPPLPSVYSLRLRMLLQDAAKSIDLPLPEGAYACVTGPNYETPAEVRALKAIGADAVGMSTVHEARTAAALGMEVGAISCVANLAAGISPTPLSHAEVLANVRAVAGKLAKLLRAFFQALADEPLAA
ncbi:MAG TPA: purine-nucleoside phosphorylase [Gemmataceae bacterium]|jgi:purine-nucleoside phosphorylase|nr:purine-nucleoside phosphorylase [Gemmataceae bacterium]